MRGPAEPVGSRSMMVGTESRAMVLIADDGLAGVVGRWFQERMRAGEGQMRMEMPSEEVIVVADVGVVVGTQRLVEAGMVVSFCSF